MKAMKNGVYDLIKHALGRLSGSDKFSKHDALLLKTSLMLAAIDGEVSEDEVAHFKSFAEKCRGYNESSFEELWEKAIRSAGYLMLQSRFLPEDALVSAFIKEAEADFVSEIVMTTKDERDEAFRALEWMASSDGDYSDIERQAIQALTDKVRTVRTQALNERYSRSAIYRNDDATK